MQKEKIKIVVADDHPVFRDGLCCLLTLEEDFEVVGQAGDGHQVLDVLQQHEADILLVDLKMPGLDGLATLQRLQAEGNKARVIVLTASEDQNEFVRAMELGASGIVQKQTATELLMQSIRKVHAGEIWLDSYTTATVIRQFVANEEAPPPPLTNTASAPDRERSPLSRQEREIIALVAQGFKVQAMAEGLFVSPQTIMNHLDDIFDKLDVANRTAWDQLWYDGPEGGECVIAGDRQPRLPHRPPRSACAEPPVDPYGNWVTEIPSDFKKSE
jgi:DNA-binding NarL/FixJ family response regulator